MTANLARLVPNGNVIGVDASEGMIEVGIEWKLVRKKTGMPGGMLAGMPAGMPGGMLRGPYILN